MSAHTRIRHCARRSGPRRTPCSRALSSGAASKSVGIARLGQSDAPSGRCSRFASVGPWFPPYRGDAAHAVGAAAFAKTAATTSAPARSGVRNVVRRERSLTGFLRPARRRTLPRKRPTRPWHRTSLRASTSPLASAGALATTQTRSAGPSLALRARITPSSGKSCPNPPIWNQTPPGGLIFTCGRTMGFGEPHEPRRSGRRVAGRGIP
jgi:hypothetical protein